MIEDAYFFVEADKDAEYALFDRRLYSSLKKEKVEERVAREVGNQVGNQVERVEGKGEIYDR